MTGASPPGLTSVPVLWLYGADAVGKTTVAWSIYERLTGEGVPMAFVDTDYLGFCQPGFEDGPARLVELNLGAMWANFRQAGARALAIIFDHQLGRDMLAGRAAAGQRRHQDAVRRADGAQLDGIEQVRHLGSIPSARVTRTK